MNFIDDQEVHAGTDIRRLLLTWVPWRQIELVQLGMEGSKPAITTKPISEEGILRVT